MTLTRLIYSSHPFGFDSAMLSGILINSRRNNTRDNITGALICRADVYLQLLEGPDDKVEATMQRIKRDDRHVDVRQHVSEPVTERLFGAWAMLDDPARSWLWSQEEIAADALVNASEAQVLAVFTRLAAEKAVEA